MRFSNRVFIIVALLLFEASTSLFAQLWTNGQNANYVLGQPDFTTGRTDNIRLWRPAGIAIDPTTGKLFVADPGNNRVLRWSSANALVNGSAAEAVLGQPGFYRNDFSTTTKSMNSPQGIAIDASGRLFVADAGNNRVLRFDSASTKANGANADGVLGQTDFVSSTASSTASSTMNYPQGVAIDLKTGKLFVSEANNHRVTRWSAANALTIGGAAEAVLGQANFTTSLIGNLVQMMNGPRGLTIDGAGHLFVADRNNNRILRFDNASTIASGSSANGVLGQAAFGTSVWTSTQNGLNAPSEVTIDGSGRLYVVDYYNCRILRYDNAVAKANGANADGVLGQTDFISNVWNITQNGMRYPYGVALDAFGRLYVSDATNNRVLRFDNAAAKANGANANGILGNTSFTTSSYCTASALAYPTMTAVDPTTGKLFVVDYIQNRVLRWSSANASVNGSPAEAVFGQPDFVTGSFTTQQKGMQKPWAITIDASGRLWVADYGNNRILRFDNASTKATGANADGVLGQTGFGPTFVGSATTQTGMNGPNSIAIDGAGRLYVSESGNNRVLRFDNAASKANGANADAVLGQTSYTTKAAAISQNSMSAPWAVAVDASGRLFVADANNNRVLRFDNAASKTNGSNADAVLGEPNYTTVAGVCTQTGMNGPTSLSIDKYGSLYIADQYNSRVSVFKNAGTLSNGAPADFVLGQSLFTSNSYALTQNTLNAPQGVYVDSLRSILWVADAGNGRVLGFNIPANAPAAPQNLTATPGTTQVMLKWSKNTESDFLRYRIFRGSASNNETLIDSTSAGITDTTRIITSLANGTTYFFRIAAVNTSLMQSIYSTEVSATTNAIPAAPQNLTATPDFGQVMLNWNRNTEADFQKYFIYMGTDAITLSLKDSSTTSVLDTTKLITGLTNGTKYYFEISARSTAGLMSAKSIAASATPSDVTPPIINHQPYTTEVSVSGGATNPTTIDIFASASDASGVQLLQLQYQQDGLSIIDSLNYASPTVNLSVRIPSSAFISVNGAVGVSYRLIAKDIFNNTTSTQWYSISVRNGAGINIQAPTMPTAGSFPDSEMVKAYTIFSVPFDMDDKTPAFLASNSNLGAHSVGSTNYVNWRLQQLSGNSWLDYEEIKTLPVFTPGSAVVLIIRNGGKTITIGPNKVVKSADLWNTGIILQNGTSDGWYLLGTPANAILAWDDLMFVGGTVVDKAIYTNGWIKQTTTKPSLSPWSGIAVKMNPPTATCTVKVRAMSALPRIQSGNSITPKILAAAEQKNPNDWFVSMTASRSDIHMKQEETGFGMHIGASADHDQYDSYLPPIIGDKTIALGFSGPNGPMMRDVRPIDANGAVWPMKITTGDAGARVKLDFSGTLNLPDPSFVVYLIDLDEQMAYNLKNSSSVEVSSGNGVKHFQVIAGKPEFLNKNNASVDLLPTTAKLFPNYPNPFNPSTVIRYTIPYATQTNKVTLKIFNTLGQEIATLVNEQKPAGYYETTFNASGFSSGVYFYRLTVSNGTESFRDVKKMILLK